MGFAASYRHGKANPDPWVKDLAVNMRAVMFMEFDTKTMVAAGRADNPEVPTSEPRVRELTTAISDKLREGSYKNGYMRWGT